MGGSLGPGDDEEIQPLFSNFCFEENENHRSLAAHSISIAARGEAQSSASGDRAPRSYPSEKKKRPMMKDFGNQQRGGSTVRASLRSFPIRLPPQRQAVLIG